MMHGHSTAANIAGILVVLSFTAFNACGQEATPHDRVCASLNTLDGLELGMSVEEVVRVRPNVKRSGDIDRPGNDDPLAIDYRNDTLCEIIGGHKPVGNADDTTPFVPIFLQLDIQDRKLTRILCILFDESPAYRRHASSLLDCMVKRYGSDLTLNVELAKNGPRPTVVWPHRPISISASFDMASDVAKESMGGVVVVQIWRPREGPASLLKCIVDVSEDERACIYERFGLADFYHLYVVSNKAQDQSTPQAPRLTKRPQKHYLSDLSSSWDRTEHGELPGFLIGLHLDINRDDNKDLLVTGAVDQTHFPGPWRLYLGSGDVFVADRETMPGRVRLPMEEHPFWTLYEVSRAPQTEGPIVGILGFVEPSDQDEFDVVITAMFAGEIGVELGTETVAQGVTFEDWDTFETWFTEQDTGWRIVRPVQMTPTPVSDVKDE